MVDKDLEKYRYEARALKLLSNDFFDKHAGVCFWPDSIRAPYLRYQELHSEFTGNNDYVLEIGAGTGAHTRSLLETGAFVTATDISASALHVLRKKYLEHQGKLITKMADMEFLPFDDETFDVACSAGSLSYGDNKLVMQEIYRVLKPGGVFMCVDSLNHNPVYRFNRWCQYLQGKRTRSTIIRMPTLQLLNRYKLKFAKVQVEFFGSIVWLSPILRRIVGDQKTSFLVDAIDSSINVRSSAFKFVMVAIKG